MYNRPFIRLAPLGTFGKACNERQMRYWLMQNEFFWHAALLEPFCIPAFCIFHPPRSRMAPQGRTMQIIYP